MRNASLCVVGVMMTLVGCKVYDPLYCDADEKCTNPDRPFCDLEGTYPASEGVARTCIPDPNGDEDGADDSGAGDDGGDDGDGDVGRPCSETICSGNELEVCGASGMVERVEPCPLGCFADGSRCNAMVPSNGLAPALDESAGLGGVTLPDGAIVDTDTGTVASAQGDPIAVTSVSVAQAGGPTLRVFLAGSWTIHDVRVLGSMPVAFVSSGDLDVVGVIDASADGSAPGPGARDCGESGNGQSATGGYWEMGRGAQYPAYHWVWAGSGGGGFGSAGGAGGAHAAAQAGEPGESNGIDTLVPLRGGCRGGGSEPSYHGAGGGAVQLVSGTQIRIASQEEGSGAVHTGGGGGKGAEPGVQEPGDGMQPGAGGGGSGGGILLESPVITIGSGARLLAAGGGGGGGIGVCDERDGRDAPSDGSLPVGGDCPFEESFDYEPPAGGSGGSDGSAETGQDDGYCSGSGGGGQGRIRVNTATGEPHGEQGITRGVLTSGTVGRR